MKDIIIFDLDGTLAQVDHRRYLVEGPKKSWEAFHEACVNDTPNEAVIQVYRALLTCGRPFTHLIFSGRSDIVRPQTVAWLDKHLGLWHDLKMRKEGDNTPDDDLKRAWVEPIKHRVFCVFDDRTKVVNMWRSLGIPCFQVAPGDF